MNKQTFLSFIILCGIAVTLNAQTITYRLENPFLTRILEVNNGVLATQSILNKLFGKTLTPLSCEEFSLRISDGTDKEGTDRTLTTKDFIVLSVSDYNLASGKKGHGYKFILNNKKEALTVTVCYELADNDSFCHKYLQIRSGKDITLERIDVESISLADALQNYTTKEITAQGSARWKPGLGQPLYTTETATYWGIEFPAATNLVTAKKISCGYLRGSRLPKDEEYTTYKSVVGVADDPAYLDDAFYAYIDKIRKRPLRLQIQYNSWFDFWNNVSGKAFAASVRKVNSELVLERGCSPLSAYVIDDGWQDADPATADWSEKVWTVNAKFSPDFSESRQAVKDAGSKLGLWLSPASILGGLKMVPKMREYGYESLSYGMSMTGAVYMQKLEDRVVELASEGISYFKFDGLFGHLNIRDFELQGRGTAAMPQLGVEGFSSNDERLNDSRYDELKLYYLTAGTERLMKIFNRLGEVNPDIFIAITNGAYLSPWWLQYIDVVWLVNAGDAAEGNTRNVELVYRDNIYHQIWKEENTKFPMNSVFNHEPKKIGPDKTPESFRNYLYMNLSRGTGFIELYIKTDNLSNSDWDILAGGLKWAQKVFPLFHNIRMHGGSPRDNEVYGYSAWNKTQGYLSFHNPSKEKQIYNVVLDRNLGLLPATDIIYHVSSPLGNVGSRLKDTYYYGDVLSLTLNPGEIVVLDFTSIASSSDKRIQAVYDLIERVTPGYSSQYRLEMIASDNGADVYEVDGNGKEIILRGNTPVALATAFNWYLKYTCQAHVSWFGNQLNLPEKLPQPREREHRVINGRYRVYMNYCTISYTAAWWDWERWQKELDFMAMNSVNMPLFTIGLDAVWYNTLLHFNFSDKEARAFLSAPGHAAWQWMQNLQSYGGPLPKSIIDRHVTLGKKIIERQLELGMQPIQQGFSGYVPRELKEKYPMANINLQRSWCGFKGVAQLDPTDSLFTRMGRVFLEEQARLFGAHGVYAADPFHESAPPIDTPEYLKAVGKTIHHLFREFDPQSIWAMQSWSLREEIVKAVPKEALLILDLRGSSISKAEFWGYPTVVGNLHNFGGRINMHGDLALLASNQYSKAKRLNPAVCGSGLFMEAIEQNPVYYELAFEMPCHQDSINLQTWLKQYVTRRYGALSPSAQKAWMLLLEGPYRKGTNGTEKSSIVAARPALDVKKSGPNAGLEIVYEPDLIIRAQSLLLEDRDKLSISRPYRFDLVDVQRQMMTNLGQLIHRKAVDAFRNKDRGGFTLHSGRFLEMLTDMDTLLRTRTEYSFDRWLTEARSWGETEEEKNKMERDATSLVTIWGADGDPHIFDYSWREWAGLINGYYLPRWQKFYAMLQQHLEARTSYEENGLPQIYGREAFRANDFYNELAEWELSYVESYGKARTPIVVGDEIEIVGRLFKKYLKLSQEYYVDGVKLAKPLQEGERTFENLGEDL